MGDLCFVHEQIVNHSQVVGSAGDDQRSVSLRIEYIRRNLVLEESLDTFDSAVSVG
jgi:hypothetical protein